MRFKFRQIVPARKKPFTRKFVHHSWAKQILFFLFPLLAPISVYRVHNNIKLYDLLRTSGYLCGVIWGDLLPVLSTAYLQLIICIWGDWDWLVSSKVYLLSLSSCLAYHMLCALNRILLFCFSRIVFRKPILSCAVSIRKFVLVLY